jgi:hypothetical protein
MYLCIKYLGLLKLLNYNDEIESNFSLGTISTLLRYGIYPLTSYKAKKPPLIRPRAISPEQTDSVHSGTPEPFEVENRKVVNMMCNLKPKEHSNELMVRI